jgi:hypothetical protein
VSKTEATLSNEHKALIEILKRRMGYTEEVKACRDCAFVLEEEDRYLDRSWNQYCTYHADKIGTFSVKETASCAVFKRKQKKGGSR